MVKYRNKLSMVLIMNDQILILHPCVKSFRTSQVCASVNCICLLCQRSMQFSLMSTDVVTFLYIVLPERSRHTFGMYKNMRGPKGKTHCKDFVSRFREVFTRVSINTWELVRKFNKKTIILISQHAH